MGATVDFYGVTSNKTPEANPFYDQTKTLNTKIRREASTPPTPNTYANLHFRASPNYTHRLAMHETAEEGKSPRIRR